jgi:hypothetical protein
MSEIARFRIVRPPKRYVPTDARTIRYPAESDASAIMAGFPTPPVATHVVTAAERREQMARHAAQQIRDGNVVRPFAVSLPTPVLAGLRDLSAWMDNRQTRFSAAELTTRLAEWASALTGGDVPAADAAATLVGTDDWGSLRVAVGDGIIAHVLAKEGTEDLRRLCSWFLVVGFVEAVAGLSQDEIDGLDTYLYLRWRVILLPDWTRSADVRGEGALLARQPAFTDYAVVREEWSCYVAGEIAHIENVLKGEKKVRTHERADETTEEVSKETERNDLEERDTQSTDRASLKEEAGKQTSLQIGFEGQVDVNADYGPVKVETSLGASLSYSEEQSRRKASETSREIVSSSLNRVEERVAQRRATLRKTTIFERNEHTVDNSENPSGHVVGIYRWVDKISRLQVFTYPHRFVLEFQIPEPAAYVRWLERTRPPVEVDAPPPPPFELRPGEPLEPRHLTAATAMELAARFKATGVLPPPEPRISVSNGIQLNSDQALPTDQGSSVDFAPSVSGQIDFAVPPEYHVVQAKIAASGAPVLAKWRDVEIHDANLDSGENYYATKLGYHAITVGVAFGGKQETLSMAVLPTVRESREVSGARPRGWGLREAWFEAEGEISDLEGLGSGQVRATVVASGAVEAVVSANLVCVLKPSVLQQWQLDAFDRLQQAHAAWQRRYDEAVKAQEVIGGIEIPGHSPARNVQTVREELKRQVIEMLLGRAFEGNDLVSVPAEDSPDAERGPTTRLAEAVRAAPLVQFLEQAFEWSNMTYILYPYYWATRGNWPMLQPLDGADPSFVEFLRSGSARVVVPARPSFENDVLFFAAHGLPWGGGPIPLADDDEGYVSVAQEIQDLRGAPDQGVPGDLWEVREPTSLVWLDNDSTLPKQNERRRLEGTPLIELCPHDES